MTLEDTSGKPGPQRCHHEGDAAFALFAAIAQIGLALRESQDPVAELGKLFARLAETLAAARAGPAAQTLQGQGDDSASAAVLRELLQQLQSDVFKGIQQLQFYDRLVQHLSHLQDYLIAIANELDSVKAGPQAQEVWDALHEKLRRRLISDEQRGLLDLFLTPDRSTRVAAKSARPDYSAPGSLEIF
jgi:hypothetical protein